MNDQIYYESIFNLFEELQKVDKASNVLGNFMAKFAYSAHVSAARSSNKKIIPEELFNLYLVKASEGSLEVIYIPF